MYLSNVMLGLLYIYIIIFFLCEVVFKIFLFLICFFKNKIFQLILIIILAKDDCFQLILKAIDCKLNDLNTSVSNLFQKNETITIVGMDYFLTFSLFSRTYLIFSFQTSVLSKSKNNALIGFLLDLFFLINGIMNFFVIKFAFIFLPIYKACHHITF